MTKFDSLQGRIKRMNLDTKIGRVTRIVGNLVESDGPEVSLGDICLLEPGRGIEAQPAEVVGFSGNKILLMPLSELTSLDNRTLVRPTGGANEVSVGPELIGRVIDGLGRPIDDGAPIECSEKYPLHALPPPPLSRRRIVDTLSFGVRAMDAFITCGKGQRLGIFSAAGVGKSTLLGMVARGSTSDVNVIALIGERGREVRDFIERDLGPEGMARSILVVSTSAEPPLLRIRAAFVATAIAEYFRDKGQDVLLMMDSVTRFALAQRDIGLAVGEQPTTRGFTPSVFSQLPRLVERSGTSREGSITGIYSVLVEGNDHDEPVADALRGLLDGHIVLSRSLAEKGQYPAIDVCASLSRLQREVVTAKHLKLAARFRSLLAAYNEVEDLILTGAYREGSDPRADEAIGKRRVMADFLSQDVNSLESLESTIEALEQLFEGAGK